MDRVSDVLIRKLAASKVTSFMVICRIFFMVLYCVMLLACAEKGDPPPIEAQGLQIDSVTISEGSAGEVKQASFTVRLIPAQDGVVTVDYEFISSMDQVEQIISEHKEKGLADINQDKVVSLVSDSDVAALVGGTLTFSSQETEKTIVVDVIGDALYEMDESFGVKLFNSSGPAIVLSGGLGTIANDDTAPQATIVLLDDGINILDESEQPARRFAVKLSEESGVDTSLKFAYGSSNTVGIATFRGDFMIFNHQYDAADLSKNRISASAEFSIDVGELEKEFVVRVIDDGRKENEEIIQVILVSINEHAVVGRDYSDVVMKIASNDQIDITAFRPLSDTGANGYADDSGRLVVGNEPVAEFPMQDADLGRDADNRKGILQKAGGGKSGFDFTALNMAGNEVKVNQEGHPLDMAGNVVELDKDGNALDPVYKVRCVRDNWTQLVWEIKKRGNEGLQAAGKFFYWYEPDSTMNGGEIGKRGNEDCTLINEECNILYYTAEINMLNLCGMTGWRVPTLEDLRSIADYGPHDGPGMAKLAYDTRFFRNEIIGQPIWSSITSANDPKQALTMRYLNQPSLGEYKKSEPNKVTARLVNDTLITSAE